MAIHWRIDSHFAPNLNAKPHGGRKLSEMLTIHTKLNSFSIRLSLTCAVLSLAAFFSAACSKGSQETASNNQASQASTADAAIPATLSSPSPATVPTTPVGPVGQTTPTGEITSDQALQEAELKAKASNLPVTISPAKPSMTPAPDPFLPRPTPTIVMKDGKIVQEWQAPADALSLNSPFKDNQDAARIGREFYLQRCADCHGKEGKGNGYLSKTLQKPPTNLASQLVQANSDGELFWKITNGKSPMPSSRIRFTDEQRWYIVAYLRTFKP
jgi:mono/diheme cytochrome c family protein